MVRKTKAEAELTRQRLLDAAEQLFCARGVARTSLQDIAQAAGATRGAVYWHFEDKAALFQAMLERVTLPLEQALQQSAEPEPAGRPPLARLVEALLAALEVTVRDPQVRRVFEIATHKVEYVNGLEAVGRHRVEVTQRLLNSIEQALRLDAERVGCALPLPAAAAARGLHALIDGLLCNWLLEPQAFDLVAVGRQTIVRYLCGLGLGLEPGGPA
ncbi:MAG: hypothetical protein RJA36_877 [Pseudomonadota bacterium]|jgi:TetR/AcrR family acrAB operon transcriptional repressor